jgi:hypothetical protein
MYMYVYNIYCSSIEGASETLDLARVELFLKVKYTLFCNLIFVNTLTIVSSVLYYLQVQLLQLLKN